MVRIPRPSKSIRITKFRVPEANAFRVTCRRSKRRVYQIHSSTPTHFASSRHWRQTNTKFLIPAHLATKTKPLHGQRTPCGTGLNIHRGPRCYERTRDFLLLRTTVVRPVICAFRTLPRKPRRWCRITEHEAEPRQPGVQSLFVRLDGARGFRRRPVLRLRKRQAWPFLSDREPSTKAAAIGSLVSSLCRAGGKSRDGRLRLRKGNLSTRKPAGLSKRHPGEF